MDQSWRRDGSLYPGVVELFNQLRGEHSENSDCSDSVMAGFSHVVVLTARPPWMISSLQTKLQALIESSRTSRLGILPGAGGVQMVQNGMRILGCGKMRSHVRKESGGVGINQRLNQMKGIGETKVQRFKQYLQLFPDCAGFYVFLGDDGQADISAAYEMLRIKQRLREESAYDEE